MKIVYLKVEDPIAWKRSDVEWYEDDTKLFTLTVVRVAGILVAEDKHKLTIGEITVAQDNQTLADEGARYPRYRYLMTIAKKNILDRQDFEVNEGAK